MSTATATRQPRQPRQNTSERWAAALDRARANGLHAFNIGGDARFWFVTSASTSGSGYTVSVIAGLAPTCLCKAGEHDPVCMHRALILDRLGLLPRVAPARAAAPSLPPVNMAELQERKRAAIAAVYGDDDAA